MKDVIIAFVFIGVVAYIVTVIMTYIPLIVAFFSICLGIYLVKKIYHDEELFGHKLKMSVNTQLIACAVVFLISISVAGGSIGWYIIQGNTKQAELNEAANSVYEEIKESYTNEDFDSVKEQLDSMKEKYGKTPAYSKAYSEFGDFEKKKSEKEAKQKEIEEKKKEKAEKANNELNKKRKAEWDKNAQEMVDGYCELLRNIPGVQDVFENVESNGATVNVLVNGNWYILSKDAKRGFIQRAVVLWRGRLNGFSALPSWHGFTPKYNFVHEKSGKVLATWDSSLGPWISD